MAPPVPTEISISGPGFTFDAIGQVRSYSATVHDQYGDLMPELTVTWSSSDPSVLEVDGATGTATAVGNGTAEIRASVQSAQGSRPVTVAQVPSQLAVFSGDQQAGTVANQLPQALIVRAVDANGNAAVGVSVTFSVVGGSGFVTPEQTETGTDGRASGEWVLGTSIDVEQRVRAEAGSGSAEFIAVPLPDVPAVVEPAAGDGQTGYAFEPLPEPLEVLVTDEHGNPVSEVEVTWDIPTGAGEVSPNASFTDEEGRVAASWELGLEEGQQSVSAEVGSVAGLDAATFSAEALPNAIIAGTVTLRGGLLAPRTDLKIRPSSSGAVGPDPVAPSTGPGAVPGELIVTFRPEAIGSPAAGSPAFQSSRTASTVASALRSSLEVRLQGSPALTAAEIAGISPVILAAKIRSDDPDGVDALAAELRAVPGIAAVEPNYVIGHAPPPGPDGPSPTAAAEGPTLPEGEPHYPLQAWHYESIWLHRAWQMTIGSGNVTVAVVDDGIRSDHPDLADNLTDDGYDFVPTDRITRCGGGFAFASGDGDGPDPDPTTPASYAFDSDAGCITGTNQYGSHGTHVSATIGAVIDGQGGSGVTPSVRIRPVRVLGTTGFGSFWTIAQGILYAAGLPASIDDQGTTVQAPYGADVINLSLGGSQATTVLRDAVEAASAAGSLLVAAAGNADTSEPSYPAAFTQVLAVSAVDPYLLRAPYSNFGSWIDIAAPGGSGFFGGGTEFVWSAYWDFETPGPYWTFLNGTSMAAPHVSGVAALVAAASPGISRIELRQILLENARDIGSESEFGAGLVDAFASVRAVQALPQDLYVRLIDARTGEIVETKAAESDRSFQFNRLPDGDYHVFAGLDEYGDQRLGVPGRFWGALGGAASATTITVSGTGLFDASFDVGTPVESDSNDTDSTADVLPAPGYLYGELDAPLDTDVYRIAIPAQGEWSIETLGWLGGCGLAIQANTVIDLYRENGSFVDRSDDGDTEEFDYCGRITRTLPKGIYFLEVTGSTSISFRSSDQLTGYYGIRVYQP